MAPNETHVKDQGKKTKAPATKPKTKAVCYTSLPSHLPFCKHVLNRRS